MYLDFAFVLFYISFILQHPVYVFYLQFYYLRDNVWEHEIFYIMLILSMLWMIFVILEYYFLRKLN